MVEQVPIALSKNGVTKAEKIDEATYKIEGVIEKPSSRNPPSPLGTVGRHRLTPQIHPCLRQITHLVTKGVFARLVYRVNA